MSTPPPRHHPHLYLVLEGSEDEYSIHKIDVHDFDPDDDTDDLNSRARPLPDPPLLRVEGARNSAMCFAAHGTKILAMPPSPGRAALALDTSVLKITAGPLPQGSKEDQFCICYSNLVVVGDRLYSMDERDGGAGPCNFEVLQFGSTSRSWSWSSVPSQPPFNPIYVTCYAVHPDARTIFFSVSDNSRIDPPFRRERGSSDGTGATFSFDTEAAAWTFRGYWKLPFHRQAHYDEELDAWVGIHDEEDERKGRVASCDVLPPATGDESADRSPQPPPWKLARGSSA
ncbi:unnamed protein product [Urochloa humidicola]